MAIFVAGSAGVLARSAIKEEVEVIWSVVYGVPCTASSLPLT